MFCQKFAELRKPHKGAFVGASFPSAEILFSGIAVVAGGTVSKEAKEHGFELEEGIPNKVSFLKIP